MRDIFTTLAKYFALSAALLLLATGGLKLVSVSFEARFLTSNDPLFTFLTNRQVMLFVGLLEIGAASLLLFHSDNRLKLTCIAWLATVFFLYRLGLWSIGYRGPCTCLGHATAWLAAHQSMIEWILKGILAYLLSFSYGLLITIHLKGGLASERNRSAFPVGNRVTQ